ncbi:predicted protein [Chaetoceros tenuissimus]|uniref:Uncharacterized protein n=1 Tax=Chaetoceros tenuissimus TaxID=426638 RepID=A0AAD3H2E3_9STRA|nr:predicted protein [Chaetoceros tenuissimus]
MDMQMKMERKNSTTSVGSDGSSRSNRSTNDRIREKIENRISILNQKDGKSLRRSSSETLSLPKGVLVRRNSDASEHEKPDKVLQPKPSYDSASVVSTLSTSTPTRYLKEVTSTSISRSRQKKKEAEERLKSLLNARSSSFDLSHTKSSDESTVASNTRSLSSQESLPLRIPQKTNRVLDFEQNAIPEDDENHSLILRPSPRRATLDDVAKVLCEVENIVLNSAEKNKQMEQEKNKKLQEYSQSHFTRQRNIQVMDNFYMFTV